MNVTIQNIAGGDRRTFRAPTALAKFIATKPIFGGYKIVSGWTDEAMAVVRYAESAQRDVGKNDWAAVVELCCEWLDAESRYEAMEQ